MSKKSKLSKLKLSGNRENKQIESFFKTENNKTNQSDVMLNKSDSIEIQVKRLLKETETLFVLSEDEGQDSINSTSGKMGSNDYGIKKSKSVEENVRNTIVSKFFKTTVDDFEELQKTLPLNQTSSLKEKLLQKKINKRKRCVRQTTIKSAFAKNEQIFSELMAQHSLAENFNPDDVQLALACSLSEAENGLNVSTENFEHSDNIQEVFSCSNENTQKIRDKLKQYGFKTNANIEDYNLNIFQPRIKTKVKWANKFTPLTLRCSKMQQDKLNKKIETFLSFQFSDSPLDNSKETNEIRNVTEGQPFQFNIISSYLKSLLPEIETLKFFNKGLYLDHDRDDIQLFYVTELFEPRKSKPNALLKDFRTIPGRDLSPPPRKFKISESITEINNPKEQKGQIDTEIIKTPLTSKYRTAAKSIEETKLICERDEEIQQSPSCSIGYTSFSICESFKTNSDYSNFLFNNTEQKRETCFRKESSLEECAENSKNLLSEANLHSVSPTKSPTCKRLKKNKPSINVYRAISPDIFALSDEEFYSEKEQSLSENLTNSHKLNENAISDHFSSNQIRTFDERKNKLSENEINSNELSSIQQISFIDLTQNEQNSYSHHSFNSEGTLHNFTPNSNNSHISVSSDDDEGYNNVKKDNLSLYKDIKKRNSSLMLLQEDTIVKNHLIDNSLNENKLKFRIKSQDEITQSTKNNETIIIKNIDLSSKMENISNKSSEEFCDLTQVAIISKENSKLLSSSQDSNDSCILLSDDEINYSILNSVKTTKNSQHLNNCSNYLEDFDTVEFNQPNISFVDFLDDIEKESQNLITQNDVNNPKNNLGDSLSDTSDSGSQSSQLTPTKSDSQIYIKALRTPQLKYNKYKNRKEYNYNYENFSHETIISPKKHETPLSPALTRTSTENFISDFKIKEQESSSVNIRFTTPKNSFLVNELSFVENSSSCRDETFDLISLRKKYGLSSTQKSRSRRTLDKKSLSSSLLEIGNDQIKFQKFSNFQTNKKHETEASTNSLSDEFDEFDYLVYGDNLKKEKPNSKTPSNFENLLIDKIATTNLSDRIDCFEVEKENTIYVVKTKNVKEKPDYKRMDSPTRLKELYNLGLKPLKKKQAVLMLEFIYNQTHPILIKKPVNSQQNKQNELCNSIDDELFDLDIKDKDITKISKLQEQFDKNWRSESNQHNIKNNNVNLADCFWEDLHGIGENTVFDDQEIYIFQTNVNKKIPTALLPFHVAWYNLMKSHLQLRESVLHFEPVNLQEIYLFLKSIGYRYDPKEIKRFFDSKCIIFVYDLSPHSNGTNKNTKKRKLNKNFLQH